MPGNDRANSAVESQSVEPSTDLNNPSNLNFVDSDDEEQNNPEEGTEGIESETDEADEEGQESDDSEEQDDEAAAAEVKPDAKAKEDNVLVTLKGGDQVPLEELKNGYMRDRDYRHKTQEIANKGRSLDEMTTRVNRTIETFADYLAKQLPDEPQTTLAIQNPAEYTRQKAMYDAAMANVQGLIRMANEPKDVRNTLTSQQQSELIASENAKLAEAFPQTTKAEGREKFFTEAFDTARDLGFSDEEMKNLMDHRYFKLAYYARKGIEAEQAKTKVMAKVNNAPPAVPNGKSNGQASQKARGNQDAMKRLSKTGSIKDAMSIDFD
jgi:hypothetical protein